MFGKHNPKHSSVKFHINVFSCGRKTDGWIFNHHGNNHWCKVFFLIAYEHAHEIVYESSFMKPGTIIKNIQLDQRINGDYLGIAKQVYYDDSGIEVHMEKHLILFISAA